MKTCGKKALEWWCDDGNEAESSAAHEIKQASTEGDGCLSLSNER
jgi:hypothetical protein